MVRSNAKAALDHPSDPSSNRCILELMEALDQSIPAPKRAIDKPFLMHIEGGHTIPGRGTVATGKIDQGVISLGKPLEILGTSMLMPGHNGVIAVALDKAVAIDVGTHFAMREGGRTVGSGVVTQVRD